MIKAVSLKTVLCSVIVATSFAAFAAAAIPAAPRGGTAEVQSLRQAYMTLYVADHDYKGHRIGAMRSLEKACKLLGTDITGDGKGHETQAVSDAQVRAAQQMIEKVRATIAKGSQPEVVKHLDKAVEELTTALKIK